MSMLCERFGHEVLIRTLKIVGERIDNGVVIQKIFILAKVRELPNNNPFVFKFDPIDVVGRNLCTNIRDGFDGSAIVVIEPGGFNDTRKVEESVYE